MWHWPFSVALEIRKTRTSWSVTVPGSFRGPLGNREPRVKALGSHSRPEYNPDKKPRQPSRIPSLDVR